jgi:hypothetical protein
MNDLAKALWETHQAELDPTDVVRLEQNYCCPSIVDVVVIDPIAGEEYIFPCFDTSKGTFPY